MSADGEPKFVGPSRKVVEAYSEVLYERDLSRIWDPDGPIWGKYTIPVTRRGQTRYCIEVLIAVPPTDETLESLGLKKRINSISINYKYLVPAGEGYRQAIS